MFIEDFIDEFYAFDFNNWSDSLETVLQMLNFPVNKEYTCDWKEFLYERSGRFQYFGAGEKKLLSECREIAMYSFSDRFRGLKLISVMLTGNPCLRNEKAYDIYKLFRKIYGRYVFFVVCFDRDISFVGTSVDGLKKSEAIISDWFGENTDLEVMNRILDIDFALFSYKNIRDLYGDYLWSIARPYVKYRESKMYLIYGCEQIVMYESVTLDPDDGSTVPVDKVDREETLSQNAAYYLDLYENDYFVEESDIEDSIDILDEDDAEFEWTMLEMELQKENFNLDEDDEDDFGDDEDEYDPDTDGEYDDISGMNPEEMLKNIRGE